MVTGKTPERVNFARKSIPHFLNQTFKESTLLIINQHSEFKVLESENSRVIEVKYDSKAQQRMSLEPQTLGEVRNYALGLIPLVEDAMVYIWDDDDYHSKSLLGDLYGQEFE